MANPSPSTSDGSASKPARAAPNMDRSLALNPRNANGSHYRAHLLYETGEHAAGFAYLLQYSFAHILGPGTKILLGALAGAAIIAVGAGHLAGQQGLLHQLQLAGFTLTPAPF